MTSRRTWLLLICALAAALLTACGNQGTPAGKKVSPVTLLKFSRTGGLAGSKVAGTVTFSANHAYVDADGFPYRRELSSQERKQLLADAEAADFSAAPGKAATVPDAYQFEITVTTEDGRSRSLSFGENSEDRLKQASPAASRLAAWVQQEIMAISIRRI